MSKDDPAQYALLGADGRKRLPEPPRRPIAVTALYCCVMVINGGLVGAFGPSLEPFSRQTGTSLGVLGGAIMQNRLAKLGGTVLWGYYANRVQQTAPGERCALPPHTLMAASLLVIAACCAAFGFTKSGVTLQFLMITSGFFYGVSDSGANLMITWVWQHDVTKQRINVAVLNAMFTVGAFVTPMIIATSMHHMRGAVWPAYYFLAVIAIIEALLLPQLSSPDPIRHVEAEPSEKAATAAEEAASASDAEMAKGGGGLSSGGEESTDEFADEQVVLTPRGSKTPATGSKAKGGRGGGSGGGGRGWVYVGDPEAEAVLPRYVVVMLAICTLCFFANGCEHAVATWLSSFGIQQRHLGEETMAIMTSNFWTAMSLGRVAWACFAGYVTSAWPALFANTLCCVVSCLCMFIPSHALLWSSAMGVGMGVASSFPAAVTLPAEMGITMTPRMMTTLQLSASFGEMFCPFVMGIAFQFKAYPLFYMLMLGWQSFVLVLLVVPWSLLTRKVPIPGCLLRSLPRAARAPPPASTIEMSPIR